MSQKTKSFTPDEYCVTYTVNSIDNNKRLDQYLMHHFASFSREQIKRKILAGDIQIQGRSANLKPSSKIKENEIVIIRTQRGDLENELWDGKEIELESEIETLYENDDIIAINKPPFMATHPTGKHLFYCATVYLEYLKQSPIYSIHRLDRETSGVLLLSKTVEASRYFTEKFENKQVRKAYFFIAHKKQNVQFPFTASERLGTKKGFIPELYAHCFPEDSRLGKASKTHFHKLYSDDNYVLGLAFPITGRQHQIRSHAAFHALPLLGDKLYNGDPQVFTRFKDHLATAEDYQKMQIPRHALHSMAIDIEGLEEILFAPLTTDLREWIDLNLNIPIKTLLDNAREVITERFNKDITSNT
ncbi:MAG: RluA family pseudouridine synthase [Halobacteriovoraceae bacterium]|nr:RluA family pseudouridine synthase [Halobacteriovoraceae bacterium]